MSRLLCWIRRDLRLADNIALAEATDQRGRGDPGLRIG